MEKRNYIVNEAVKYLNNLNFCGDYCSIATYIKKLAKNDLFKILDSKNHNISPLNLLHLSH